MLFLIFLFMWLGFNLYLWILFGFVGILTIVCIEWICCGIMVSDLFLSSMEVIYQWRQSKRTSEPGTKISVSLQLVWSALMHILDYFVGFGHLSRQPPFCVLGQFHFDNEYLIWFIFYLEYYLAQRLWYNKLNLIFVLCLSNFCITRFQPWLV